MTVPVRPHGIGIRGFSLAPKSKTFSGPFGRIFRALPPAEFGDNEAATEAALNTLGHAMVATPDPVKDGPDGEESGIPALYTYFGQFIDHDLTFDPASSLQRQNDPDALVDFRTPRFDLDSVYGRGPDDQPYLYADSRHFLLGEELTGQALGKSFTAHDLPRSRAKADDHKGKNQARAIIGDPRNDENIIVSQLQGLILRLHNKLAKDHRDWSFSRVQQEVRFHYQWVVLHDFLPTIVAEHVMRDVLPSGEHASPGVKPHLEFYNPHDHLFMPLEFSAAAYRFGHSMVRPGYRLNDAIGPLPIFPFATKPNDVALTGFDQFPTSWGIDWGRFIDLEPRPFGREPDPHHPDDPPDPGNAKRTQLAYRIDTSLVNPLGHLPARVASDPPPSLAGRNLLRGWRMRIPSGQDVARAMGLPVLPDSQILIGKFTGDPKDVKTLATATKSAGDAFKGNCPLWTYILAETEEVVVDVNTTDGVQHISTRRLGPVGGRIVAETFIGILAGDSSSYLNVDPLWSPSLAVDGRFGLRELVIAALKG